MHGACLFLCLVLVSVYMLYAFNKNCVCVLHGFNKKYIDFFMFFMITITLRHFTDTPDYHSSLLQSLIRISLLLRPS